MSASAREVEKLKEQGERIQTKAPRQEETYEWIDKRTGEVHQVPKGIDPGWDYNPGMAAYGEK
ncbi:MAG: hypothetical protein OEY01_10740 [Desulfobulbaceae bacterium]|nr:hypothetical protein [Desulfobulbaceae bacterium]